jgi:hypothetical protein
MERRRFVKLKGKGGWRPGSGRKKGSGGHTNRMSQRMITMAKDAGKKLGHEFMLDVLNAGLNGKLYAGHKITFEDMKWAAEKSANYFAPKLQATTLTGANNGPVQVLSLPPEALKGLSADELVVLEKVIGRIGSGAPAPQKATSADPATYAKAIGALH